MSYTELRKALSRRFLPFLPGGMKGNGADKGAKYTKTLLETKGGQRIIFLPRLHFV